ncbi:MAG: hypothetical protein JNM17_30040 [Archangium sp.]|nr:hypothetical protein [Archangium sp.]
MAKALLLSICISLIGFPLWVAKDPHPARGLKRALLAVVAFNFFYIIVLRVIVPRFG